MGEASERQDAERPRADRIAVVYNVDWSANAGEETTDAPPSLRANAEVANTAAAVAAALDRSGMTSLLVPVHDGLGGLVRKLRREGVDAVFNLVESLGGESAREPELPRRLDAARIPYTGAGGTALATCLAKDRARKRLAARGVPIPHGVAVTDPDEAVRAAAGLLSFPVFVKPARTDASIGIDQRSFCRDAKALRSRVAWLLRHLGPPVLVEEWIGGTELNVSALPDGDGLTMSVTMLDYSQVDAPGYVPMVTYEAKWVEGSPEWATRSLPARGHVPDAKLEEVKAVAAAALRALDVRPPGRVDIRLDAEGRPRVIDVNPNPDLHPEAGYAIAMKGLGLDYDEAIARIARAARCSARKPNEVDHARPSDRPRRPRNSRPTPPAY